MVDTSSNRVASSSKAQLTRATPTTALSTIVEFETALLSASFDPNPLLELIALAKNQNAQVVHKAIWSLHRVFVKFIGERRVGRIYVTEDEPTETDTVKAWVAARLEEYVAVLCGLFRDKEEALRVRPLPWSGS
jgi:U3 small nucleolar RNA-associated protein 19